MRALLVGEAWGEREARFNHPLVGPSGVELGRLLHESGMGPRLPWTYPTEAQMISYWLACRERHGIAVSNVFNTRPANNNIDLFFTKDGNRQLPAVKKGKYVLPEHMHHVLRLWDEISTMKPNLVIALGNTACWAILGKTNISALRGTMQLSKRLDHKVIPTYHPAAILRQWSLRTIVLMDLQKAHRESQFPDLRRTPRYITIPSPDVTGLRECAQWANRGATAYAGDIETAMGQISMIGFARNAADALVIPFHNDQGRDFWPTPEIEWQARNIVQRILSKPVPKIFQNGLYDLQYILTEGFQPTMCLEDTMLRQHSTYPEMLKGLGFLGSIYCDEIAWKTMRKGDETMKRDE